MSELAFPVVVIELAEFLGIHAELTRHLHMSVRQAVAFTCRDPQSCSLSQMSNSPGATGLRV